MISANFAAVEGTAADEDGGFRLRIFALLLLSRIRVIALLANLLRNGVQGPFDGAKAHLRKALNFL